MFVRVGRSVKKYLVKNVCFMRIFTLIESWEGGKNLREGIFLYENLLGEGHRKQTTFFSFLGPIRGRIEAGEKVSCSVYTL